MGSSAEGGRQVTVWDLPTRICHWLLALLIPFSWWSATHDHLPWHRLSGYTILGVLVFRVAWGFIGSSTARFSEFLRGPGGIRAYIARRFGAYVGHNPLGGLSVVAILAVLAMQVGLGLFSIDEDALEPGPLADRVSFDTARAIAHLHHRLFWVLVGLIAIHLAAVAWHALRGRNLTRAMFTGRERLPEDAEAPRIAPAGRALAVAAFAFVVAWFVAHDLKFWGG